MNIQQNFNALLTLGAVAARTGEHYKTNAAYRTAELKGKNIDQAQKGLNVALDEPVNQESMAMREKQLELSERKAAVQQEKYELKGKESDYEDYRTSIQDIDTSREYLNDLRVESEQRAQEAYDNLEAEGTQKLEQNQSTEDLLESLRKNYGFVMGGR